MVEMVKQAPSVKVLDNLDNRHYIIRMDADTFKMYWFDQYANGELPYEITMHSLKEAYQAKAYDNPMEALSALKE